MKLLKKKTKTNKKPEYSGEKALSSISKAPGILKYKQTCTSFQNILAY